MAESARPQRSLKYMIWLFLIEILLLLVLVPNHWLTRVVEKENQFLEEEMGPRTAAWVMERGANWYTSIFVETGVNDEVYRFFVPSAAERRASRGLEDLGATSWFPWINGRADALGTILQQVLQRTALVSSWLIFFVLLCVPFVWDGAMQWKIKQYSFQHSSTAAHSMAAGAIGLILMAMLIGLFAPAPFPPVAIPIFMILVMVALNIVARHTAKEI
jgi:hypothetical protein